MATQTTARRVDNFLFRHLRLIQVATAVLVPLLLAAIFFFA